MEKMTKRDRFNQLLALSQVSENSDLVAFINHELDMLAKKNASRSSEMTDRQKENLQLSHDVVDYMDELGKEVSIAMLSAHFGVKSQRMTPIVTKLIADGQIFESSVVKRVRFFKVVA